MDGESRIGKYGVISIFTAWVAFVVIAHYANPENSTPLFDQAPVLIILFVLAFIAGAVAGGMGRRNRLIMLGILLVVAAVSYLIIAWRGAGEGNQFFISLFHGKLAALMAFMPALAFAAWCVGSGRKLIETDAKLVMDDNKSIPLIIGLSFGAGLILCGLLSFALGVFGLWKTWAIALVYLFTFPIFIPALKRTIKDIATYIRNNSDKGDPASRFLIALIAIGMMFVFIKALGPEIFWDSLTYHLEIPKRYLMAGGFDPLPYNPYAHMPMLMEMVFTPLLAIGGPNACKIFEVFVLMALAYAVIGLADNRRIGLGAAALTIFATTMLFEGSEAMVDLPLAVFIFLAFSISITRERPRAIWVGIFAGAAMSVKYFGILYAVPALIVFAWAKSREGWRRVPLAFLIGGVTAAALLAPWLIKNAIETGNPVYPLLWGIFDGANWNQRLSNELAGFLQSIGMGRSFVATFSLPWDLSVHAAEPYDRFAGAVSPLWLALVPGILIFKRSKSAPTYAAFGLIILIAWRFGSLQTRFLLPAVPWFALAGASAMEGFASRIPDRWRYAPWIALGALCVMQAGRITEGIMRESPAVAGFVSRNEYLGRTSGLYAAAEFANRLAGDSRMLFMWENRAFWFDAPVIADGFFEASYMLDLLADFENPDDFLNWLRARRITHVLVNANLASGFRPFFYDGSVEQRWKKALRNFNDFEERYLKTIYAERDIYILEIQYPR